jgi:Asp/Glu/hydantoin racemase
LWVRIPTDLIRLATAAAAELSVGIQWWSYPTKENLRTDALGQQDMREQYGTDVVVIGCAGMARYRKPLQDEIRIPVVEPTQTAVAMAIGCVRLNSTGGKRIAIT